MSPPSRLEGEYRSAQHEGSSVSPPPAPPTAFGAVHFDPAAVLEAMEADSGMFCDFADMFIAAAAPHLRELDAAAAAGDWRALSASVHRFKGSLSIFHAGPALHLVERIERAVREQPGHIPGALLAELAAEVGALCDEIARCIDATRVA